MGMSQQAFFEELWVEKKVLSMYKKKKTRDITFYFNKCFCPGKPVLVNVIKTLSSEK